MAEWMIYGANGYTGDLVARRAVADGDRPILAGRNASAITSLAAELGLDYRVIDLRDPVALRSGLDGVRVVAHCAGPFRATSGPMVDACLTAGVHYVDVTGEIDVFDAVFARHDEAVAAGIILLPGAGFDVVPTDCLAAALATALPGATTLELAFRVGGGLSPGTAKSSIQGMAGGGRIRRDGVLVHVPTGTPRRRVTFPSGIRTVSAIRWGDLVTAYRSTAIPDITTYTVLPSGGRTARLASIMRWSPAQAIAGMAAGRLVHGPNSSKRLATRSEVWGQVTGAGRAASATLIGPNAYDLTADSVVHAVRLLLAGTSPTAAVRPGAHTPSSAFGAGFVTTLHGVTISPITMSPVPAASGS